MNLDTIDMPVDEARARYEEYSAAVKARHNVEDAVLAAGYKALSEGKKLISLQAAIRAGGIDTAGRPKLAIAPATAEWCWMSRWRDGALRFAPSQNERVKLGVVKLPAGTFPEVPYQVWEAMDGWRLARNTNRALVPIVPPALRPSRALIRYHILWEAEWEKVAPVDPALLRHLSGDLWLLCSTWDLSPLERMVLAERFVRR